jgi:cellulose synthase/poly-beta-1,6-N-acetylglucosamine synthase-like glycosyltransferase
MIGNQDGKIHCTIGIMAHNEEANIGSLLEALLAQNTQEIEIDRIVVVASGCTDRTEEIVESFQADDSRIKLLRQARREGKASAINLMLQNEDNEVIVLQSADTLPVPYAIEALVSPFLNPEIGMVGGHPVPTNPTDNLIGFGVHILWDLHHKISLQRPKMGELIAFRNVFR